jgi:hypothetical protein
MKKILFLIFIGLFFFDNVYSALVDTTTAKIVAKNFYLLRATQSTQKHVKALSTKQIELRLIHQELDTIDIERNVEPFYYVYNVNDDNGFVIVSADDEITPILAYSFDGKYDDSNLPPAYVDWMNKYKRLIKFLISNKNRQQSIKIKTQWNSCLHKEVLTNETVEIVSPLLDKDSIKWNQDCNYNIYCPNDANAIDGYCKRSPAGCVAVAMGQIMRYWKHPKTSQAISGYLSLNYFWINGSDVTTYNWDKIKNTLTNLSSDIEKRAVSELLYNCGISVQMNYGSTGSGAYDRDALVAFSKYFDYSNKLQLIEKNNFNSEDWLNIIKNELKNNRPVYYSGNGISAEGTAEGHAFVCDGYNSNNEFHFNWGWGGVCNGYFYHLSSLIPQIYSDIYEPYDFTDNQMAIINIVPNKPDLMILNQSLSSKVVQRGFSLTASCIEDNSGETDAGTHVISIYLSSDSILTPEENGDIHLGDINCSISYSGTCSLILSKSFQTPSNTIPGKYYIIYKADGSQIIDELNEDNNTAAVELTVTEDNTQNPKTKKLTTLEYFIDNDPGFENGTSLSISTPDNIVSTFNIPLNNIIYGFHVLFFRAKDSENRWSITQHIPFYMLKVISSNISKLEYFIDTDPGFGNGNKLSVPETDEISKSFNIPLSNVSNGFHVLYVRSKDNSGNWSITSNSVFYKIDLSSADIVKMEYFLDVDPGFDNATSIPITKSSDINKSFNIDLSNVSNGFHKLFIRTKNTFGKWSITSNNTFYRMTRPSNITELEYFFDMDPGYGNGTVISVIPMSSDITTQFYVALGCLSSDSHTFYVRTKDDLGYWSLIYSKIISVTTMPLIVTQTGNILHSNASTGNQWYNQKGLINGATGQDYTVTENGEYYVIQTQEGCSSTKSNTIKVVDSGFDSSVTVDSIILYPNPTSKSFCISGFEDRADLILTDMNGKVMLAKQVSNKEIVSISSLPNGIYIVQLITNTKVINKKLVKN